MIAEELFRNVMLASRVTLFFKHYCGNFNGDRVMELIGRLIDNASFPINVTDIDDVGFRVIVNSREEADELTRAYFRSVHDSRRAV